MLNDLTRYFNRTYSVVVDWASTTPISKIPVIVKSHQKISNIVGKSMKKPPKDMFIKYEGSDLYISSEDYAGKVLYNRGRIEPSVTREIKKNLETGDAAIDIGGYLGYHTVNMRNRVGESGNILVFEPNPRNVSYMKKSFDKNGWENITIFEKALSDKSGTTTLVKDGHSTESIKKESDKNQSIDVEVIKLSEVVNNSNLNNITLIKIDVEGAEINIIRDIEHILSDIDTIILEIHHNILEQDEIDEILTILSSNGNIYNIDSPNQKINAVSRKTDESIPNQILFKSN